MRAPPKAPAPSRAIPWSAWVGRALAMGAVASLLVFGAGVATYLYFERRLPSVDALHTYRPPQVTKVYCSDGSLCVEFFKERRTWVDVQTLPPYVKNAFLAAEDADFYKHEGLNYFGMLRAALKSVLPGKHLTGASTITQQACRNLLLSQERTLARKIREWILTPRMEKALTKDEILNLYINQINFGRSRYGIEEAALYYFGKSAKDLSLGEAASLAGTVQSPERINPVTSMVKAKKRQKYVLTQLERHGFVPKAVADAEMKKPLVLAPRPPEPVGSYYAEEIRRQLAARYGEDVLYGGGLKVQIAMNPKLQASAEAALRAGLESYDRRAGYRGPLTTLAPERFTVFKRLLQRRLQEAGKRSGDAPLIADLSRLALPSPSPSAWNEEGSEAKPEQAAEGEAAPSPDEVLARTVALRPLSKGLRTAAYVSKVDDAAGKARVDLIGGSAELSFDTLGWARIREVGKPMSAPSKMSDIIKPGQIIRIRVMEVSSFPQPLRAVLDQAPEVQGALVALEPISRHLVALVGGYDFASSSFDRAIQAKRQPGSSFKPFVYGAALASHKYTPISVVNDAPEPIRDAQTGKVWTPQNYERGGFEGAMTLRQALSKSKNTVSVRLIEDLGTASVLDFARRAGIRSNLPDNFTLALGTGEVTVLELANAYTTLQSLGKYAEPILIVRVTHANGTVLEEHSAAVEETIPPAVAYLVTSLMKSVVDEGTAAAVRDLNRPAAGKTGTTSDYRDAWFSGFTSDYVATSWVGFDDHSQSLGTGETGSRAALPLWLSFMRDAEEDLPPRDFEVPSGVSFAKVDSTTGLLVNGASPGRLEPFLDGTAPTALAPSAGQADPSQFLFEDSRGAR